MTVKTIKRTIFNEILKYITDPEIIVILGPRQTGKTTILGQIKNYLLENKISQEKNILMFNLDFISDLELFKSQEEFFNFLKARIGDEKLYVFVDEAQRIENVGLFFKGIYDKNLPIKFILTGSSSFELKVKVSESLTGRKIVFTVYPLDFHEYLLAKDKSLAEMLYKENLSDYDKKSLLLSLFNYINYGGYPRVVTEDNAEKKHQALKEIYSSYIEKDIIGFLKVKKFSAYAKLLKIIASQIGGLVNYHELSQFTGLGLRTVESYLDILAQTFVAQRVVPFFKNTRKELIKMPKIYFIDSGLRNFALLSFGNFEEREDMGALLENYIFSALIKKKKENLHFWRTKDKSEVDFIIENADEIIPLEIKAVRLTKPEIPRSFNNFISRYNPPKALLVNLSYQGEKMIGATKVYFILPYEIERIF